MSSGNGDMARICETNHSALRALISDEISEAIGSAAVEASRARQAADRAANAATAVGQEIAWLKDGQRQILEVLARHDKRWTALDARVDAHVEGRARAAEASIAEIHVGAAKVSVARWQAFAAIGAAAVGGGALAKLIMLLIGG